MEGEAAREEAVLAQAKPADSAWSQDGQEERAPRGKC